MRHQRSFLHLGALFLLVALLAGTISPALSATWNFVEFMQFTDTPNLFPEVVSSPSGDFYLAYLQESGGFQDLKILKWNGSSWDTLHTLTPSTPNINIDSFGDYLSLVVNSDNDIHLAFRGYLGSGSTSTRGVHYGHYDGSTWTFDDVEVVSDSNGWKDVTYPSLAVDGNDHPHLVYVTDDANSPASCSLVYAVKNGTWTKTTLISYNTGDEFIGYPSLVLDSATHAYVAYIDDSSTPTKLYLSTDASGVWNRSSLVTQQTSHYLNFYDMRIDSADKLYLTYTDSHSSSVDSYYATNAGGSWTFELVPGSTGYDINPHLALNTNGVKLLSYITRDATATRYLKVAYQSGSDSWQVDQADSSTDIDAILTVAVNPSSQAMIIEERQDFVNWSWKQFWYANTNLYPTGVTGVTVPADGTYIIGQSLDFSVSFNENVTVDTSGGTPYLPITLDTGGTVPASYVSGSGSSTLVFRYTVASGVMDSDGISLGTDLILNGGTIKNGVGTDADLTLTSVPSSTGILVDGIAPGKPVINAPVDGSYTNDNTPTINGTAEANSSVTITLDGNLGGSTTADVAGDWSWTPGTALPDGSHSVQATATDAAGNTGPASDANSFTVDTLAPAPPLVSVPADGTLTNQNRPAFSGTAEPGSTVSVLVDANPIGTCSTNGSGDWTFTPPTPIADGAHQVAAYATDQAGNSSSNSAGNNFTVDTTPPAAPILNTPADGSLTNQNQPAISGTAEAIIMVTVFIDGSQAGSTLSDATGYWAIAPSSPLADGSHSVYASAADAAGNSSSPSVTHTFTVDTLAPAVPSITSPANGIQTNNTQPSISGTAEPNSEINVYLDGSLAGSATATGAGSWSFTPSALSDGSHSVYASATDAAGNSSSPSVTHTFTVDTLAPAVPSITSPANGIQTNNTRPSISGTAEPNSEINVYLDGSLAGSTTATGAGNWGFTPSALSDGSHSVYASATDAAGNSSGHSNTNTFTVDTLAPAVPSITSPANGIQTNNTQPSISGTAEPNSEINVYLDGSLAGSATATGAGSWGFTPSALTDGTHSVQASAMDAAGNTSSLSSAISFTVDTLAPAVSLTSLASNPTNAPKITVTATFSEPVTGFDIASIAAENASAGNLTGSGANYTFDLTPAGQGVIKVHLLAAAAHDAAGNPSLESSLLERTYDSLPPSLLSITREDTSPTRAGSVQFALSFDEPVSGVDKADFALTVSGSISGQAIQSLWESGGVYHVSLSTGSGSGTIRLDLVDNGSITDLAGNPLLSSGTGWQDGRYGGGETYEIDRTIPVAQLLNPDNLPHGGNMPYTFTVRFSDNIGIDPAVFGDANIRMLGTGFNQLATKVSVIEIIPGTQYEVTYQVDPPDKGWESLSAPSFNLTLESDQIHDLCDNYLGEETLGVVVKEKIYFYFPLL